LKKIVLNYFAVAAGAKAGFFVGRPTRKVILIPEEVGPKSANFVGRKRRDSPCAKLIVVSNSV